MVQNLEITAINLKTGRCSSKSGVPRVIRDSWQPCVYFPEVNKPTTLNTRDPNDFIHAKRLARKKPLLAGYHFSHAWLHLPHFNGSQDLMICIRLVPDTYL